MAIYREPSEIRVERSEKAARLGAVLGLGSFGGVAVYYATLVDGPSDWFAVGAVFIVGVILGMAIYRKRDVCIIRANQIGWGSIGGKLTWVDRTDVHSVRVVNNILLEVQCFDAQDELRQAFFLTHFVPAELREALEEASIAVIDTKRSKHPG